MSRWIVVVLASLVACGSGVDDGAAADADAGGGVAVDAGEDASDTVDAGAPSQPDAAAPTCVAWVDACHVRACPSGVVTPRPDGTTCPASECPTGSDGPCACRDGVCAWE